MKRFVLPLLVILVLVLLPAKVLADVSIGEIDTSIQYPEGRETPGAFLDAATGKIYLLGGEDANESPTTTIYSFDTNTKAITIEPVSLPIPLGFLSDSVAWDAVGRCAYIYGGLMGAYPTRVQTNKIHKYDVDANTIVALSETLSQPLGGITAVLVSGKVYVFGGFTNNNALSVSTIQRHDLNFGTITTLSAVLPVPAAFMSHIYDPINNVIYLYAGYYRTRTANIELNTIVKFDVGTETISVLPETLPTPRDSTTAFYYNGCGYIFGGCSEPPSTYYNDILIHNLSTGEVTLSDVTLPNAIDDFMAVVSGNRGWLLPIATAGTPFNDVSQQKYILEFTLDGGAIPRDGGIRMTATVILEIVSLTVTSEDINFGALRPGEKSAVFTVTIENTGNVDTWVGASVDPIGTLMDNILIENVAIPDANIILLPPGQSAQLGVKLVVPLGYTSVGGEVAFLKFEGTAQ